MASVQWEGRKKRGNIFLHWMSMSMVSKPIRVSIGRLGFLKATWTVKDVSGGPLLRGERVSGSPRWGYFETKKGGGENPFPLEKAMKRAGWNHAGYGECGKIGESENLKAERDSWEISPPLMGNPVQIVKQPPERLLRKNLPHIDQRSLLRGCGLEKEAQLSEIAALAGCSEMLRFGKLEGNTNVGGRSLSTVSLMQKSGQDRSTNEFLHSTK